MGGSDSSKMSAHVTLRVEDLRWAPAVSCALLMLLLSLAAVVLHRGPLLCARSLRLAPRHAELRCQHLASAETNELKATRDSAETHEGVVTPTAAALTPTRMAEALERVRAHDYSCIANGQVFVATSWLPAELLRALQADVSALQVRGQFFEAHERSVAGVHARDWSSISGEPSPSAARAALMRLFEALHLELEVVVGRQAERAVLVAAQRCPGLLGLALPAWPEWPILATAHTQAGRRLIIDGPGSMTKYSLATPGAPLGWHVDQHHEAFNKARRD